MMEWDGMSKLQSSRKVASDLTAASLDFHVGKFD